MCNTTLDKRLRPGPGGRLAATGKYGTCKKCVREVLPKPTFMLPITVVPLHAPGEPQPRELLALDVEAEQLLGCAPEEYLTLLAQRPSLSTLVERLLEGRRLWLRSKENKKRQKAAIVKDVRPLDPAPPLVASADALLRGKQLDPPRAAVPARAASWTEAGGARLVYKYHGGETAGGARRQPAPAAAGSKRAAPASPPPAGAAGGGGGGGPMARPSTVFDAPRAPRGGSRQPPPRKAQRR